jgi:two-component system sensor histidine kinase HydH
MGMGPGMMGGRRRALGIDVPGFVVEYAFPAAHSLIARSLVILVLVCAATALLLGAAAISFRRSREAERLTEQLGRDQQLKSLGQMSAVLSHELRNPLTSLKGHAQLLLEKLRPGDAARPDAERMLEGALRLESVANQILEFARHDTLALRAESPSSVAQAAIDQVGDPRARLSVDTGVETWNLNRPGVEQLLVNLIRNAADASPPDRPIEVAVARQGRDLVFGVRDHGPGLPPGEEARVFEPFFTRSVRGTGLGLAIAKQIAEAHGGRIEGMTHPEGGALFRVIFPAREAAS